MVSQEVEHYQQEDNRAADEQRHDQRSQPCRHRGAARPSGKRPRRALESCEERGRDGLVRPLWHPCSGLEGRGSSGRLNPGGIQAVPNMRIQPGEMTGVSHQSDFPQRRRW